MDILEFDKITQLEKLSNAYGQVDDSYVFSHITPDNSSTLFTEEHAMKLNGVMVVLMLKGEMLMDINFEEQIFQAGSILFLTPSNVIHIKSTKTSDIEAYVLFFDIKFLQSVNINLTSISIPQQYTKPQPILKLTQDEVELLTRYYDLLHLNSERTDKTQISKNVATSLLAAMFYQIVGFHHRRIGSQESERTLSRRHDYVRDFIKLVHIHYTKERSVTFYSSKLFITPKYLSLLVKEATGRSAAQWIDEFVLMEAKNMLKFSGKNIQQVAYALNFTTQSSFGKYFKHLTGMSPTEYQKS